MELCNHLVVSLAVERFRLSTRSVIVFAACALTYLSKQGNRKPNHSALIFSSAVFFFIGTFVSAVVCLAKWMNLAPELSTFGNVITIIFSSGIAAAVAHFQMLRRLGDRSAP